MLVSLFRCRHDGGRVAAGMPPGRCDKRLRIPQDRFDWRLAHGAKHGVAAGSVIAPATSPRQRASVATAQAGASGQGRPERALERISSTTALHCIRLGAATHGGRTAPFLFCAIPFTNYQLICDGLAVACFYPPGFVRTTARLWTRRCLDFRCNSCANRLICPPKIITSTQSNSKNCLRELRREVLAHQVLLNLVKKTTVSDF